MDEWNNCEHEWKEVESQNLNEHYGDVKCVKCGCPGEMEWATRKVQWPAT